MARRRVEASPDASDGPPARLLHFDAEQWIDRTEPVPESWREGYPFHLFQAKRRWQNARRQWATEHGMKVFEAFPLATWLPGRNHGNINKGK